MKFATSCGAVSASRRRWIAVIVAIVTACGVAAEQARAEAPALAPAPAAIARTAMPFISDRLSGEVIGHGPDVILIPGLASSREVWRPVAQRLSATHRVHLIQMAGFAGAPWSHADGEFVAPEVAELARYIQQAGLDHPAVIGHSLGGLSGLMLAQAYPERVGRLMIVDALPFYSAMFGPAATPQSAKPFADQAAAQMLAADDASFEAQQAGTAILLARDPAMRAAMTDWSRTSDRHAVVAAFRDVMTTDARPGLPAMRLPVTALYASDADGGAPAAMADALWGREYSTLPGVILIRVDDSRHFIMADQPARFDALVDAFLK